MTSPSQLYLGHWRTICIDCIEGKDFLKEQKEENANQHFRSLSQWD